MARDAVIRVSDLVVGFGRQVVLDHVSLTVERGEVLALVGGSGSGKSVMLRSIVGLVPTWSGQIDVLGSNVTHADDYTLRAVQKRWGILFQQGALLSSLTVLQNVEFPMREHLTLSDRLRREIATAKLDMVGLAPKDWNKFPSELSGGMTKRVALARALALDPELVFLDEPTSGLDPISAGAFDELIRTLQQTLELTVFMITHDLESLYSICDRIAVLAQAKLVACGDIDVMLKSEHPWVKDYFNGRRSVQRRRAQY